MDTVIMMIITKKEKLNFKNLKTKNEEQDSVNFLIIFYNGLI